MGERHGCRPQRRGIFRAPGTIDRRYRPWIACKFLVDEEQQLVHQGHRQAAADQYRIGIDQEADVDGCLGQMPGGHAQPDHHQIPTAFVEGQQLLRLRDGDAVPGQKIVELQQRDDDKPETVRRRLEVYARDTAPLVDFYKGIGLLVAIDAQGPVDEVTKRALGALDSASAQ